MSVRIENREDGFDLLDNSSSLVVHHAPSMNDAIHHMLEINGFDAAFTIAWEVFNFPVLDGTQTLDAVGKSDPDLGDGND